MMPLMLDGSQPPKARTITFSELLIPLCRYWKRLLLVMLAVISCGVYYYATTPANYVARTSLLAVLGPEYGLRPTIGEGQQGGASFDVDQIVATEGQLLNDPSLHLAVIHSIGLDKLYPGYLVPRTGLRAILHEAKERWDEWLREAGFNIAEKRPTNPDDLALLDFAKHLKVMALKSAHVISVTFSHEDPELAALTLNTLTNLYLDLRTRLYNDQQAPIVEMQVDGVRKQLLNADAQLARYKAQHDIGAYESRRINLLTQQSNLEGVIQNNTAVVEESSARKRDLEQQLNKLSPTVQTQRDIDTEQRTSAMRISIDALNSQLARLRATYSPDSEIVKNIERQLATRTAEYNTTLRDLRASATREAQNPLWLDARTNLGHAINEMEAAKARVTVAESSLKDVLAQLHVINQHEEKLSQLERQRKMAEDMYSSLTKMAQDRQLVDAVDQRRKASVRAIDQATVPSLDSSLGKLVLMGSVVLAAILGFLMTLISDYGRRVYLTPGEVERDLKLAVLACVPDRAANLPTLRIL